MPWYSSGTVSVTANSATVTGTGTAFSANARTGDAIRLADGRWYEVTNIASATVLSIKPNYQGATASGQAYAIAPMQGYVKESADRLRKFVDQFGATLGSLGAWSTAATADAALTSLGFSASGKSVAKGTPAQGRAALELVKQTSPTDTTPGALMAVGAFGLGGEPILIHNGDLNTVLLDGLYYGGGLTNAPIANSTYFVSVLGTTAGSGRWVQHAWLAGSVPREFVRQSYSGVFGPWRELFHTGNILGTVSQSGGVPTGAWIEYISNANGEAWRFAGGLQICTLAGSLSYAESPKTVQLPAAFSSVNYFPVLSPLTNAPGGRFATATRVSALAIAVQAGGAGAGVDFSAIVFGRWY